MLNDQFMHIARSVIALNYGLDKRLPYTSASIAESDNIPRHGLAQRIPDNAAEVSPKPVGFDFRDIAKRERRRGEDANGFGTSIGCEVDMRCTS